MRRALLPLLLLLLVLPLSAATFKADDGVVLHYDVVGKGEPVVLLSGGPGFAPDYLRPIAEKLSKQRSFVLLHQRGTGRSALEKIDAETMKLDKLVADVEALRRALGAEKLTLAGHSWGGIVTMMYAGAHPDRVRAIVLLSSGGPTLQTVPKFMANLTARLTDEDNAKIREWSAAERMQADRKRAMYELTIARAPAYFADRAKAHLLTDGMTSASFNDAVFWALMGQIPPSFDLREPLRAVKAPVMIIHGKKDPLESADEVHAAFAGSQLEMIDDAGHYPWLEQPDRFYAILSAFLE